mmetsp:Transcript_52198/g.122106  ORF Transcript_52198/g.122106 Transcript_52198/m.122106 type:complete len:237 (+) Transcript_52198:268-978(+)
MRANRSTLPLLVFGCVVLVTLPSAQHVCCVLEIRFKDGLPQRWYVLRQPQLRCFQNPLGRGCFGLCGCKSNIRLLSSIARRLQRPETRIKLLLCLGSFCLCTCVHGSSDFCRVPWFRQQLQHRVFTSGCHSQLLLKGGQHIYGVPMQCSLSSELTLGDLQLLQASQPVMLHVLDSIQCRKQVCLLKGPVIACPMPLSNCLREHPFSTFYSSSGKAQQLHLLQVCIHLGVAGLALLL